MSKTYVVTLIPGEGTHVTRDINRERDVSTHEMTDAIFFNTLIHAIDAEGSPCYIYHPCCNVL